MAANLDEIRHYAILQMSTVALTGVAVIFSSSIDIATAAYATSSCGARREDVGIVVVSSITLVLVVLLVLLSLCCIGSRFHHDTTANVVRAPAPVHGTSIAVLVIAVLVVVLQALSMVLKALASTSV